MTCPAFTRWPTVTIGGCTRSSRWPYSVEKLLPWAMITTVAVSPEARYGLPTVVTTPAAAATIGEYITFAMSRPLWKPPHRAPNGEVSTPRSGHTRSLPPVYAPRPDFAPTAAAAGAYS